VIWKQNKENKIILVPRFSPSTQQQKLMLLNFCSCTKCKGWEGWMVGDCYGTICNKPRLRFSWL